MTSKKYALFAKVNGVWRHDGWVSDSQFITEAMNKIEEENGPGTSRVVGFEDDM